ARVGALPVGDDRAGATLALVAALLRAGQSKMLAQRIEQRGARIDIERIRPPVDREPYVLALWGSSFRHLAHGGWRRERQSRGPRRVGGPPPGWRGEKDLFLNTPSACLQLIPAPGRQLFA